MVADLVGRVLVTDKPPGVLSHVQFLATMVARFVATGRIMTSSEVPEVPMECLTNHAQAIAKSSSAKILKRGWQAYVKQSAKQWSQPVVKVLPASKARRSKPSNKAKPAARQLLLADDQG